MKRQVIKLDVAVRFGTLPIELYGPLQVTFRRRRLVK